MRKLVRARGAAVDERTFGMLLDELEKFALFHIIAAAKGSEVAFGTSALTWPGAKSQSNDTVVNHGLGGTTGRVPKIVLVLIEATGGEGAAIAPNYRNKTATQFSVYGEYVNGFAPAAGNDRNFSWLAIA